MFAQSIMTKAPVPWLPAGLISWYAPGGAPLALVTSWIALIGGCRPRIKTAWHGCRVPMSSNWTGGDFVVNIPYEDCLEKIRAIMTQGRLCLHSEADLGLACLVGVAATAPRLLECAVQIECVGGRLVDSDFETELSGEIIRLHRGDQVIDPADVPELCAIHPLRPMA